MMRTNMLTKFASTDRGRRLLMRRSIVTVVVLGAAILLSVFTLAAGELHLSVWQALRAAVGFDSTGNGYIVSEFRLPRVAAATLVGLGLGAAGAVTQSVLRNPLASPDIIGVTGGASAVAVLAIASGGAALTWLPLIPLPVAACVGGFAAGAAVLWGAWRGELAPHRVILVGLGVNAGCGALTAWLLLRAELDRLATSLTWLTGSLNSVRTDLLGPVAVGVAVGLILLGSLTRSLGLLRYDLRVARSLGLSVARAQLLLLGLAITLAALVTALAGPVPFVAFVAPQIAYVLFRTEGPPMLGAALIGAVMMLASDAIASHAFSVQLPVGVVTSFIGAPVLAWILLRSRGNPESGG